MSLVEKLRFLRKWQVAFRDASRPLPILNATPCMANKYGTVPLRFTGSDNQVVHCSLIVYVIFVSRKAVKSGFLCDRIEILNRNGSVWDPDQKLQPGQLIRVRLAIGESISHALRSAICIAKRDTLEIAIVYPTKDLTVYEESVTCITVRPHGRRVLKETNRWSDREIEWEIISTHLNHRQVSSEKCRRLLPSTTLQLFSRECYANRKNSNYSDRISRIPGLGLAYAFGATRLGGFTTLVFRTAALGCLIFMLDKIVPFLDQLSLLFPDNWGILIPIVTLVALVYGLRFAWNRSQIKPPTLKSKPRWPIPLISNDEVDWDILWDGSTKRALELGNRICRTGIWSALWFRYLEQVPVMLKTWLSRFGR